MIARQLPRLVAAASGFAWFLYIGGGPALDPLNTAWLYSGDLLQHWTGFVFFQQEPWRWPLGSVSSLLYPIGTNIGFTDSNPLLALSLKPFAGVLPTEYQVIGLWLCACFVLQGYFGAALSSTVTESRIQQALGGCLLVMSPALLRRVGHDTLCAHWLILWALYLGLKEYDGCSSAGRAPWRLAVALVLAAAVHPYLAAMVLLLAVATFVRLQQIRMLSVRKAAAWIAVCVTIVLSVWASIGYLVRTPDLANDFGTFSADLTTFFNSRGASLVLPSFPMLDSQHEGFAFLGLGGILGFLLALVALAYARPRRSGALIVVGATGLAALFAVSSSVRIGGNEWLGLQWLYGPFMDVVRPFRSSGRFIWPLHYVLLLVAVWGATHVAPKARWAASAWLALLVILQAADTRNEGDWFLPKKLRPVAMEAFDGRGDQYRHLALAPMQVGGVCADPVESDYVFSFMVAAQRLRLTFNSGVVARIDADRARRECGRFERAIDAGTVEADTIYVVSEAELPKFRAANAACGRWAGNWICVNRAANPRYGAYLGAEPPVAPSGSK